MRLSLYENVLQYIEATTAENNNAVFVLSRFHVSYALFTRLHDEASRQRYQNLLQRLRRLNTLVVVPLISEDTIESRALHVERTDPVWQLHLQKRLLQKGFSSIGEMYRAEQNRIRELLVEQELPYELVVVE